VPFCARHAKTHREKEKTHQDKKKVRLEEWEWEWKGVEGCGRVWEGVGLWKGVEIRGGSFSHLDAIADQQQEKEMKKNDNAWDAHHKLIQRCASVCVCGGIKIWLSAACGAERS